METKALDRQTLLDIAVQTLGGVEGVFSLAERNGISMTARLTDGQCLLWETEDIVNVKVRAAYENKGLRPATEISAKEYRDLLAQTAPYNLRPRKDLDITLHEGETLVVDKIDEVLDKLESGKKVESVSGQPLTRIFSNPYDTTFA